jgi:hypothetical protein
MHSFALQMVGRQAGPCDLSAEFSIIHDRIVTDQVLGSAESAAYALIARIARRNDIAFERVASHFIRYAITQREALELIRGAYSALGEADNLQTVLTQPPSNFLKKLRDEEAAFLVATDVYITTTSKNNPAPPYDVTPAALADAIVQRLEGVPVQATTYSLSLRDDATAVTPVLTPPAGSTASPLQLADTVAGVMSSYYATPNQMVTAGIGACMDGSGKDGFSYVLPLPGQSAGFKIGSSCALHLERHLLQNVPAQVAPDWTVSRRYGTQAVGAYTLRNAATLDEESAADALALGGSASGRGSGFSAFQVAADAANPSIVTLTIDLPGAPATPIVAGSAHAFAAGTGVAAAFARVPSGPNDPDRYALQNDAGYLSVGSDGFAAISDTPTYFDFQPTNDGRVELVYDGGVLYVDSQYKQLFYGESPDDRWANTANIASGAAAVRQWRVPSDGQAGRIAPTSQLVIRPPCLDGAGNGITPSLNFAGQIIYSTECSNFGLAYIVYVVTLANQDTFDRAIRLTVGGQLVGTNPLGSVGGLHCWIPGNGTHFDSGSATAVGGLPGVPVTPVDLPANIYDVTVPKNGTVDFWCEILDLNGFAAEVDFNVFTIQPCQDPAGQSCVTFP